MLLYPVGQNFKANKRFNAKAESQINKLLNYFFMLGWKYVNDE